MWIRNDALLFVALIVHAVFFFLCLVLRVIGFTDLLNELIFGFVDFSLMISYFQFH